MTKAKTERDGEKRFANKYFQGSVEREATKGKDKNTVSVVASVPVGSEAETSKPEMGVTSRDKTPTKAKPSKAKDAVVTKLDRKIIDAQTGLNGRLGS